MTYFKKQLGQRLKSYRKQRGLSQEKLAEIVGVTARSLGNIETGSCYVSMSNFEKIITALEIEPYEPFIFSNENPNNIIFNDIINKLEQFKNDARNLKLISLFINNLK